MRRLLVAAMLAGSVLTVTSGAQAKEPPDGFRLCAPHRCVAIGPGDGEPLAISLFFGGSVELWTPKVPVAPFYTLYWKFQQGETHFGYYVPLLNAVRFVGSPTSTDYYPDAAVHWLKLDANAQHIFGRVTSSLQPFPTPTPSGVTVGGRAVRDPASYMVLWSVGTTTYNWPRGGFMPIKITSDTLSPWTDRAAHLSIARRGGFLLRDTTILRIPARLARLVRARASLR